MKIVDTGGLCEASYGLETFQVIKEEKLGNQAVLSMGPWSKELLIEVAAFCAENDFNVVMEEMVDRSTGKLKKAYREFLPETCGRLVNKSGKISKELYLWVNMVD